MEEAFKDWIYAFFDSSQTIAVVAIGFITLFYTTRSTENTEATKSNNTKVFLRKAAKISIYAYTLLLFIYLAHRVVDARCEARNIKIQELKSTINLMLSRDSSRIVAINSKIALKLGKMDSLNSVNDLRQQITNINYNRIQRLQNFRVYVSEYCKDCNYYGATKQKFDSLKTVLSNEN